MHTFLCRVGPVAQRRRTAPWLVWWSLLSLCCLGSGAAAIPTQVTVAPPSRQVDAQIVQVLPLDAEGRLTEADAATALFVQARLFERGTLQPLECDFPHLVVILGWRAELRVVEEEGLRFPVWEVPRLDLRQARSLREAGYVDLRVSVPGTEPRSNVWIHPPQARTQRPVAELIPGGGSAGVTSGDIQVVWPHDGQGRLMPPETAPYVNIRAQLRDPRRPAALEWDRPVRLYGARNHAYEELLGIGELRLTTPTVQRPSLDRFAPVYDFHDVELLGRQSAADVYTFRIEAEGLENRSNTWVHGGHLPSVVTPPALPTQSGARCGAP